MANQPLAGKLNAFNRSAENHSIQKEELNPSERIREAIGDESVASFSRRCDIGDSTIRKYLEGSLPNSVNIVVIADAANVNIEWLASGRGPKQRGAAAPDAAPAAAPEASPVPVNIDQLAVAIAAVEEGLSAIRRTLPPPKHAQLIASAYGLLGDLAKSDFSAQRNNLVQFIKMAA